MIEMRTLIPTVDQLRRRIEENTQPITTENRRKMRDYLIECGYSTLNPGVFDAIEEFGAAWLSGAVKKGLFIKGAPGIGKTFGVEVLASRFGWPVVPARVFQEVFLDNPAADVWENFQRGGDFFGRSKMIVIDDLGTEDIPVMRYGTPCNLMADVLDFRYRMFLRGTPTIVTSNLSDAELQKRYGYRIDDRLTEMFYFRTPEGESLRR